MKINDLKNEILALLDSLGENYTEEDGMIELDNGFIVIDTTLDDDSDDAYEMMQYFQKRNLWD